MKQLKDLDIDSVMSDMFAIFKKHDMDSIDVITVATIISGGLASVGKMNKKFYMGICEHSYDSSEGMDIGTLQ